MQKKTMNIKSNYDKYPSIKVEGNVISGWDKILTFLEGKGGNLKIAIECYHGVNSNEIKNAFGNKTSFFDITSLFKSEEEIIRLTEPDITDDPIFGYITKLTLEDFLDEDKIKSVREEIQQSNEGLTVVCGPGALLCLPDADIKIYADMARWEIQLRKRRNEVNGLGVENKNQPVNLQYKRGFFVDWRVCDKFKKEWLPQCDFLLDTNKPDSPNLVDMVTMQKCFTQAVKQPFRVVPFFDPGPWGGHWMEEVCDLETEGKPNHAWCFDCVPEENSVLFEIGETIIEVPSIDLVFFRSRELLGPKVEARFGKEFPIRFDFLDTIGGGNLSLQVHPDTGFIQENFGMHYTQDESYYILDAKEDTKIYLGVKKDCDAEDFIDQLNEAQKSGPPFDADKFVNTFPVKKHDHFLIPAGTVHCSGKNTMVLEISATPYIFTFKMWDWGRLGLDGKPRPINIDRATKVIDYSINTDVAKNELINQAEKVNEGEGWIEEKTGLHNREFIETRRHWFTKPVLHDTDGIVNVLNLVEGREVLVESPTHAFSPFIVHYAETFIVPAELGEYMIRPYGESEGQEVATIKAYVR
ncbi:class I mannose-6-phosphate isomerase [Chondrinema litorale]|uniref:class I mannose-6-phosphate isomerase n=1 Tax=Chondrinema litorale TaxID=2994555 RepID=UPI0025429275|nr:class I mannose-6-phosphate isomerase [Chondrinema litorale]UZR99096.1 class I mannose-6-phosphate isomerase [Chondrinema litorale]